MADDDSKKLRGGQTIQLDALSADLFMDGEAAGEADEDAEGGLSLPPPLPPRGSSAPPSVAPSTAPPAGSTAPPPAKKNPLLYVVGAVVAVLATVLGIWVGSMMMEPEPEPALDMEIGDIDFTAH